MAKSNFKKNIPGATRRRPRQESVNLDRIRLDAIGALAAASTIQLALQNHAGVSGQIGTLITRSVVQPLQSILALTEDSARVER